MLYIGLVVGAFLGICVSIIALVIVKDLVIRARTREKTAAVHDLQINETLPTMLPSSSAGE